MDMNAEHFNESWETHKGEEYKKDFLLTRVTSLAETPSFI